MLKKGDKLSITRRCVVQLTQYDALKPSVTFTRELGEDPESDRAEMERVCYVELRRALLDEVRTRRQMERLMGDEMQLTPVLEHCEKVVRGGYEKAREGLALPKGSSEFQTARRESPKKSKRR